MNQTSEPIDLVRFDVRNIPCRVKHGQIFQRWTELPVGGHFILINDHDPVPLYYQFEAQFPGAFRWEYLEQGPEEFHVKISRLAASAVPPSSNAEQPARNAVATDRVFDVRPIPPRHKHQQIFERWSELSPGEYFVLLNDHDPVPLRYQFEAQFPKAFSWEYLESGPDVFRVKITKQAQPSRGVVEVDARGLEAPEPLIRILDALENLPAGATLRAITDREPCHLFGEARQRGFLADCTAQADGSWHTYLSKA